jgi:hypothetical protein
MVFTFRATDALGKTATFEITCRKPHMAWRRAMRHLNERRAALGFYLLAKMELLESAAMPAAE